ncbi:MAG: hypothetical protein RLO18_26320, partial [Gimesia chilikensis]
PRAAGDSDYAYSLKDYFDLEPIDDLPPVTVITHIEPQQSGQVLVRGVTSDNYDVKQVKVNEQPVRATAENFQEWEIVLPVPESGNLRLVTSAEDMKGNQEMLPHQVNYSQQSSLTNHLLSEK